jgi:hypothetical protein
MTPGTKDTLFRDSNKDVRHAGLTWIMENTFSRHFSAVAAAWAESGSGLKGGTGGSVESVRLDGLGGGWRGTVTVDAVSKLSLLGRGVRRATNEFASEPFFKGESW